MKSLRLAGAALLSALLSVGCTGDPAIDQATTRDDSDVVATPPSSPPTSVPTASKAPPPRAAQNVLLVLVDSLRWDMPWAGYPRDIAPWMTRFEARSVSYTRAYALSATTARSVAGLLASRYPAEMKRNGYFFTRWYPENEFLAEILESKGSHSFGTHAHAYFFPQSGLDQGVTDHRLLPGTFLKNTSEKNVTSERLYALAKQQLEAAREARSRSGKPFFGYVHFMDPHSPYVPHPDLPAFGSQPRDLYDSEVRYTDEWVGKLIDLALAGGDTSVILSADHGECFGEHGHLKHGYELWEELIRVPLMIHVPGVAPRRIATPRSHLDLAPTILELMGYPRGEAMRGVSLVGELEGAAARARPVIADLTRDNLQDRRRALIDGRLKLLATGDDKAFL
ncbi:MAG: sulfatase, partial [Myxococcales bacterium]|nr:sulfatase [Myxococcales bacterium]